MRKIKNSKGLVAIELITVISLGIILSLIIMSIVKGNNQGITMSLNERMKQSVNEKADLFFGGIDGDFGGGGGSVPTGGISFSIPPGKVATFEYIVSESEILNWAKDNLLAFDSDSNDITDSMEIASTNLTETGGFVVLRVMDSRGYQRTGNLKVIFLSADEPYSVTINLPSSQPYKFLEGVNEETIENYIRSKAQILDPDSEDISNDVSIDFKSGNLEGTGIREVEVEIYIESVFRETVRFNIDIISFNPLLCISLTTDPLFVSKPSFGDGSASNPYLITKIEELSYMRNELNKNYELQNDLDFNNPADFMNIETYGCYKQRGSAVGWTPVGLGTSATHANSFRGTLNGNGYEISGVYVNKTGDSGLFGYLGTDSSVRNLKLRDFEIYGHYAGSLAGNIAGTGEILNITIKDALIQNHVQSPMYANNFAIGGVSGTISSKNTQNIVVESIVTSTHTGGNVGGAFGTSSNYPSTSPMLNVFVHSIITSENIGGIGSGTGGVIGAGTVNTPSSEAHTKISDTVNNIHFSGSVKGKNNTGGIFGILTNSSSVRSAVSFLSSTAEINGENNVGGIAGNTRAHINYSFFSGEITGNKSVGGIVGFLGVANSGTPSVFVSNSHVSGNVNGQTEVGGIAGTSDMRYHFTDGLAAGYVITSYISGRVYSPTTTHIGGALGRAIVSDGRSGGVSNSYYNKENTSALSNAMGTGLTPSELKNQSLYHSSWDFATIWAILPGETTPFLRNNMPDPLPYLD